MADTIANILSIAGSDPSGGAGIQADLKTFAARRTYGMAVLTALTAQNTQGVSGVHLVPPAFVAAQIEAIFEDIRVDAVKIGMIASGEIAEAVSLGHRQHGGDASARVHRKRRAARREHGHCDQHTGRKREGNQDGGRQHSQAGAGSSSL